MERVVQYVRGNFFAGEVFVDLTDARAPRAGVVRHHRGLRIHGTTGQRPAELFTEMEAGRLLPAPAGRYDVPIFPTPKVARDLHINLARGLYSVPAELVGQRVQVRADSGLVKVFRRGQLVKTHPRVPVGARATDPKDFPVGRAEYALRDVATLTAKATAAGPAVGVYAARLLEVPLPWTRMRTVYRLLGLVRCCGPGPVNTACARALELDVVDVTKITRMLERVSERDRAAAAAGRVVGRAASPATPVSSEVTR